MSEIYSKTSTNFFRPTLESPPVLPSHHPVREYRRLPPIMIADSGINPDNIIKNFYSKDIIKPLRKRNLYIPFDIKHPSNFFRTEHSNKKWTLSTIARAPSFETLPKNQQFKKYYFPPFYNNKNVEEYRTFSLKTDHVAIKVPKIKKVDDKKSFLKMKSEYSTQSESKKGWAPRTGNTTMTNVSNQKYDIINFNPVNNINISSGKITNPNIFNKKKGIIEYADLTRTFTLNFNEDYSKLYNDNSNRFKKFTGIFTNMYDSSIRNGGMGMPFGQKPKSGKDV